MRIAVMAAGALGGYFGARMAAAGHDVFFIARGSNLEAIRKNGLKVESVLGNLHLPEPNVTDDPAAVGPVDIVLFAVKLWDSETAARLSLPLVGPGTRVIPLQNGVDSAERIAPILGADNVVAGSAYIATVLSAPGVVTHTSQFARMVCGRTDGKPDEGLKAFADAAQAAGIDISVSDGIDRERWQKFVFLVGLSGATATTRQPLGADPGRPGYASVLLQPDERGGRGRPCQGRSDSGEFCRGQNEIRRNLATHLQGFHAARSRTRQPARTRLARRKGGGVRPPAWHSDASQQCGLCHAQAAQDG
ncbi:2-dehydropantoate 2-reductase [Bradyrhizobium elkanii]|jgi:2-dehydropantoate 2-reductase|nr:MULTISPECIES: 2-dehydropantoate 2-reductase [Bradyrhizobium]MCP1932934.1 2-dehydropantoate 2-reductase [Bradyrhizobium elkanii]MCS3479054.1 2-dehydropantoate 2-reductase [Bradyrhizobium elkanii]MCS3524922.1 2-dehydropantoate 2-reductase [Bradyrhizobium elkanii]MCS3576515.1 2-dehydropantoate 2-reductase [Bradyrhizobium elkanii]MCS3719404.1 2-dehydropantoate 2-reductase [Bradyrhizobium elkanii]